MNSSNKMNNVLLVLLSASVIATIGTIFYHFVDTSYETETAIRFRLRVADSERDWLECGLHSGRSELADADTDAERRSAVCAAEGRQR